MIPGIDQDATALYLALTYTIKPVLSEAAIKDVLNRRPDLVSWKALFHADRDAFNKTWDTYCTKVSIINMTQCKNHCQQ